MEVFTKPGITVDNAQLKSFSMLNVSSSSATSSAPGFGHAITESAGESFPSDLTPRSA